MVVLDIVMTLVVHQKAPSKVSHLSDRINEEIKRVAAMMASVCLLGAAVSTIWSDRVRVRSGVTAVVSFTDVCVVSEQVCVLGIFSSFVASNKVIWGFVVTEFPTNTECPLSRSSCARPTAPPVRAEK